MNQSCEPAEWGLTYHQHRATLKWELSEEEAGVAHLYIHCSTHTNLGLGVELHLSHLKATKGFFSVNKKTYRSNSQRRVFKGLIDARRGVLSTAAAFVWLSRSFVFSHIDLFFCSLVLFLGFGEIWPNSFMPTLRALSRWGSLLERKCKMEK